jgi:hypothetical protein
MLVAKKYANQKFGGMNLMTMASGPECKHLNGWYIVVSFWIFRKRIFVCSDCGRHQ